MDCYARGGVDGYRNTGSGITMGFDKNLDARIIAGLTAARDALVLGIGFTGSDKKGFSLSAGYDAEIGQQYTGHTLQVKAQWLF